ncbi:endoribonuclease SymE [Escherichia coli]|uniref:endoribonuclease SymE n=1 Tax=Escherichia coli TaxID=562 RepID=UPI0035A8B261
MKACVLPENTTRYGGTYPKSDLFNKAASRYPDYSRIPAITLKGQWLEAAGFATGTAVDVKVMEGCIVLTAQPPAAEESELMQSLRQVCKLSARKQKQVQEFIGVIAGKQKVA